VAFALMPHQFVKSLSIQINSFNLIHFNYLIN
jgi:hypothetical protein